MWTEAEVREALVAWREVYQVALETDTFGRYTTGLADGYVNALEMVLLDSPRGVE